ncbi:hypothetical protein DICPUDRAFT_32387, partial [Dictyostelium purpureum]
MDGNKIITEENENDFVFKLKVLFNQLVHIPTMLATLKNEISPNFLKRKTNKLNL